MENNYPDKYICPITLDLMLEPVKASDNKVYEKKAIIKWYKCNKFSPITREELTPEFILQKELKTEIYQFIEDFNIKVNPYNLKNKKYVNFNCIKCYQELEFENDNNFNQCFYCNKKYMLVKCNSCNNQHILPYTIQGNYLCIICGVINLITIK